MKRYNVSLPPVLVEPSRIVAAAKGISFSDLVRRALEMYLEAVKRAK